MNRKPDVELVLDAYFDDDGLTAPDFVLDAVEQRIRRQPQRRTWRLDRRLTLTPGFKYGIAAAAVLVVAIVGYNLLPKGPSTGGPGTSATGSPLPSAIATATATGTSEPIACEDDLPGCVGPLAPGSHASNNLRPSLAYTTTGEWLNVVDLQTVYKIDLPDPNDPYVIVWTNPVIGQMTPIPACGVGPKAGTGTAVADWISDIQANAALVATTPQPIDLGGSAGQSIEVTVAPDWKGCPFGGGYAVQFIVNADPVRTFPYGVGSTQRMLLDIVDVNGRTVIIQVYGPVDHDQFLAATADTRALIDTFRFTPAN